MINRFLDNLVFSRKTLILLKKKKKDIKDTFFIVSIPEYIAGVSCIKAKKYGAKLIADFRDIWPEVAIEMGIFGPNSIKAKIFKYYANRYYKESDYILTVSKRKTDYLSKIITKYKDKKVFWIGNGFDADTATLKSDFSVLSGIDTSNKCIISYVGNVGKAQHLKTLIDYSMAAKTSLNKLFIIAGTGGELKTLMKYTNDNNIKNVVFTGPVTKEQAKAIVCASKIAFVPLSSDKMLDSVPTKMFEAIGLGTPVLLVAKGEAEDILKESKFGVSIWPSKVDELELAFESLEKEYPTIMSNKSFAMELMKTKYSRQKYCADFEKILLEDIG